MTNTLHTYLPQDRVRALAQGETLPGRTHGSALFADISGFTALTEQLTQQLGPRRGVEELTRQISAVYAALIAEVERYGGSVIDFAGDAMMCWFEEDWRLETGDLGTVSNLQSPVPRTGPVASLHCALAMQTAMQSFPHLGLKVAIATGPARRWVVGDPAIFQLDTLAGATVARTAVGEHLAHKGEVLVDEATAHASAAQVTEWRTAETGERFAVINQLRVESGELKVEQALSQLSTLNFQLSTVNSQLLTAFILPAVYERETSGQGAFLTELRPCAVLFVRFTGIDYEAADAQAQLDVVMRQLQATAARYGGTLLQITIGDKGSYAYLSFGALRVHEDDARRALKTALVLRQTLPLPVQIGLTQGVVRVGTYGGPTRCAYGALGDEVNLAARLMMAAQPGEILVSGHVHKAVGPRFSFAPHPPLPLKGKAEPLPVFTATGEAPQRAIRLQEPTYALPMVGRIHELQMMQEKLDLAAQGQAQVIGIVAEAGMGKSRLVAEVIRAAHKKGFVGYGGTCQSDGVHTPYLVWKSIWSAFFDLNPAAPLKKQIRLLEGEIEDRAPSRVQALPLLGALLDLPIPDNDFTQTLDAQHRQSTLHILLEECLQAAAQDAPVLLVLEDLHWIDALSLVLLEQLARALDNRPLCFVLAYRPQQAQSLQRLARLPQFTQIALHELTHAEAAQAIRAKLAQLYPARSGAVPAELVDQLMARAQGNPFYLEELLNYLRDRGLDPRDPADLAKIALPDSLHTLILSRIDQLTEQEKNTLRVASIIGRLFRAAWLTGYYPTLGAPPQVQATLAALATLDITPLDMPEPELSYLFKHIVTHEVTYENLPFATRAALHEQLARYLEEQVALGALTEAPLLETLAAHYERSTNVAKQREYFRKAGDTAQKNFANAAALEFYGKLLPLLTGTEKCAIHFQRGKVWEWVGQFVEAENDYRAALAGPDPAQTAQAQLALSKVCRLCGDIEQAQVWLDQAKASYTMLNDRAGLAQVLIEMGLLHLGLGGYATAHAVWHEALALTQAIGDKAGAGRALKYLALMASVMGDNFATRALATESLALYREIGDKPGIAATLLSLGTVSQYLGDWAEAGALFEESLALSREMGSKVNMVLALNALGLVALAQADYARTETLYKEGLALSRKVGFLWGLAWILSGLGVVVALDQANYTQARTLCEESLALSQKLGEQSLMINVLRSLGQIGLAQHAPTAREPIFQSLRLCREAGGALVSHQIACLIVAAALALHEGQPHRAAQLLGAVAAALKTLQIVAEPTVLVLHAQTLAGTRAALDEAAFAAAWAEGEKMTLQEAVAWALETEA